MYLSNVMFELEFNRGKLDNLEEFREGGKENTSGDTASISDAPETPPSPEPGTRNILLKGQMKYIDDIKALIFLCSPM